MSGLTLDTGALIALERRDARAVRIVGAAQAGALIVTVPVVVVAEWWREPRGPAATLLDAFVVEPLYLAVARSAGRALAAVKSGPSVVDALVMASAATRGDRVLTGDVADLERLRAVFPEVRLLAV